MAHRLLHVFFVVFQGLEDPAMCLEGRHCPTAPPLEEHVVPNCMHGPGTSGASWFCGWSSMNMEGHMNAMACRGPYSMLVEQIRLHMILRIFMCN